jgi:hypothetical protein
MLVPVYQSACFHIPEDLYLNCHHCETHHTLYCDRKEYGLAKQPVVADEQQVTYLCRRMTHSTPLQQLILNNAPHKSRIPTTCCAT